MSIRKKLVEEKGIVGVWGLGYVGLTTACAFAREGVRVHGYDIDLDIVQSINSGKCHIPNLERWLGYSIKELTDFEILHAVASPALMKDCDVHFVAVPTEKDGKPWMQPLDDVLNQIGRGSLVIIESTLVPGTTQTYINKGLRLAVSPRRDFFNKPEYNLRNLPRIYSGQDRDVSKIVREVLSIVCDTLIEADDLTQAELVKSVENSILHVCATYAQQLALAYPNVDIRKVLKLASTHWRIPLYYPSMGTGGYCIPLSSQYVKQGAKRPGELTLCDETIRYDGSQPARIASIIANRIGDRLRIAILGLCYKGDLKVIKGSPALPIIDELKRLGKNVFVHDPYFGKTEILRITNATPIFFPAHLRDMDAIIIISDHQMYKGICHPCLNSCLKSGQIILDNYGVWENRQSEFDRLGIIYHTMGDKGWTLK